MKYLCIYNTITRKIDNARAIKDTILVSEELKDWFDFHPKDEPEPFLWQYEKKRYELSAFGLGSGNGYVAYCGDTEFSWDVYDAEHEHQEVLL